jgi:hypothetical protein
MVMLSLSLSLSLSPAGSYVYNFNCLEASIYFSLISHSQTQFPVFNVTDCDGNKIRDEGILNYIQKVSDHSNGILHFPSLHLVCIF